MIGIIISGHGNFATALHSSLNLIAGNPDNMEYVDFVENDSTETLKQKYINSFKNLSNCDSILALTDLTGGSPFKTLVELKTEIETPLEVIGGTNLAMILEVSMAKDFIDNLSELTETALEVGKNGIVKFELLTHEELECEDGI